MSYNAINSKTLKRQAQERAALLRLNFTLRDLCPAGKPEPYRKPKGAFGSKRSRYLLASGYQSTPRRDEYRAS